MTPDSLRFLEPLDVLFLRGNKLFGAPGSHGESLVPPWPSVAAGALRSRMLADEGADLTAFARGALAHPILGTPAQPGSFRITAFHLARRGSDDTVEALFAPPADVVIEQALAGTYSKPQVRQLTPLAPPAGFVHSYPLPYIPILGQAQRGKAESGYWLTTEGWRSYLIGRQLAPEHCVPSSALWRIDPRVGIGLDAATRRAADGRLFNVQAISMRPGVGFLTAVSGATPPSKGTVRLGGDGRAAALSTANATLPAPDHAALSVNRRCRLVLTSPGIFPLGWLPLGATPTSDGSYRFELHGVRARLACAAVPRYETVSGWDLAQWRPKAAQRTAPTGSVYWLDELEASEEALRKLAEHGLWSETCEDPQRRAEGFNRCTLAVWN